MQQKRPKEKYQKMINLNKTNSYVVLLVLIMIVNHYHPKMNLLQKKKIISFKRRCDIFVFFLPEVVKYLAKNRRIASCREFSTSF